LLVEVIVALLLFNIIPNLGLNLVLQLQHLKLIFQMGVNQSSLFDDVIDLQDFLLYGHLQVEVGSYEIEQE
jgi:hypothetical protein